MLTVQPHPLLDLRVLVTRWPAPLGQLSAPAGLRQLTSLDAPVPFAAPDDDHKRAVRDLLRHGGAETITPVALGAGASPT